MGRRAKRRQQTQIKEIILPVPVGVTKKKKTTTPKKTARNWTSILKKGLSAAGTAALLGAAAYAAHNAYQNPSNYDIRSFWRSEGGTNAQDNEAERHRLFQLLNESQLENSLVHKMWGDIPDHPKARRAIMIAAAQIRNIRRAIQDTYPDGEAPDLQL